MPLVCGSLWAVACIGHSSLSMCQCSGSNSQKSTRLLTAARFEAYKEFLACQAGNKGFSEKPAEDQHDMIDRYH